MISRRFRQRAMTADNVIVLDVETRLDLPVSRVVLGAKINCPETIVVIGYDADGELYLAGTVADAGKVLVLLEKAKAEVLNCV